MGLRAEVEALAGIKSVDAFSQSPDGKRVAFVWNVSGRPQVWIADLDNRLPPRQLTDLPDPVHHVAWSPRGDWLAYDVAPGGGQNIQIYIVSPDGENARRLTPGGMTNNWLYCWTKDGSRLAIGSNRNDPARMDAYLVDPATGGWVLLTKPEGLNFVLDSSPDGNLVLISRMMSRGSNALYLADVGARSETRLTPPTPPSSFKWARFSADGDRIYLFDDQLTDRASVGVLRISHAGAPGAIEIVASRDDAEADEGALSRDGKSLALVWNASGISELEVRSLDSQGGSYKVPLPAEQIDAPSFTRDDKKLIFIARGSRTPQDLYSLDLPSGECRQLTHSPHEGVALLGLVKPEPIQYNARDGVRLSGWLYRASPADGCRPMVFHYHGGPELQARPYLAADIQALAVLGISVFVPNVRGSAGFGRRFANLDNGPLRANSIRDIADTTNALVSMRLADPTRLGIMGGSYGGYMAMCGITYFPDMFAAAVNLFGIVNFETFFAHTEPWMASSSKVKYGDP